jgi:hypothetical protein
MVDALPVHAVVPAVMIVVLAADADEQEQTQRAGRAKRRKELHRFSSMSPANDRLPRADPEGVEKLGSNMAVKTPDAL